MSLRSGTISRAATERHLASDHVAVRQRAALVGEILYSYVRVRRLMRRHDIGAVLTELRAGARDDWSDDDARLLGYRLARPVRRTLGPLPWDTRCLMQSLVLVALMSRRNAACDLVIGATPDGGFTAHAWVERAGRALLPTSGYPPLTTL